MIDCDSVEQASDEFAVAVPAIHLHLYSMILITMMMMMMPMMMMLMMVVVILMTFLINFWTLSPTGISFLQKSNVWFCLKMKNLYIN